MDNGIVLCYARMCCQDNHITKFSGSLNLLATTQPLVVMISVLPGPFFSGMSNIHIGHPTVSPSMWKRMIMNK